MNDATITIAGGIVRMTATGLEFAEGITVNQWRECVAALRQIKHSYVGALSDAISYGRRSFGDDVVSQEIKQLEFEAEDLQRAVAIGQLTLDFRRDSGLTSEHLYVLARSCQTEEERGKWAATARAENLSPMELKRSIAAGHVVHSDDHAETTGRGSGIVTIHAIAFTFQKWLRNVGGSKGLSKMSASEREQVREEIAPVLEVAKSLGWV